MKLTHTQKVKLARKLAPRTLRKGDGIFNTKGWEARKYSIITRLSNKAKK